MSDEGWKRKDIIVSTACDTPRHHTVHTAQSSEKIPVPGGTSLTHSPCLVTHLRRSTLSRSSPDTWREEDWQQHSAKMTTTTKITTTTTATAAATNNSYRKTLYEWGGGKKEKATRPACTTQRSAGRKLRNFANKLGRVFKFYFPLGLQVITLQSLRPARLHLSVTWPALPLHRSRPLWRTSPARAVRPSVSSSRLNVCPSASRPPIIWRGEEGEGWERNGPGSPEPANITRMHVCVCVWRDTREIQSQIKGTQPPRQEGWSLGYLGARRAPKRA